MVGAMAYFRSLGIDAVDFVRTPAFGVTYGILETTNSLPAQRVLQHFPDARLYEWAVIALAIEPQVPDALPILENAFGAAGRPRGVLECRRVRTAIVIEFRPDLTDPRLLFALIDTELARFRSGRTTTLLTPLPPKAAAVIAASGVRAPELATDRILEVLLESRDA